MPRPKWLDLRGVHLQAEIKTFFEKNDMFLEAQFEQLLGSVGHEKVVEVHNDLVSYVRAAYFEDDALESARHQWLGILAGLKVNLGFPQLRGVSEQNRELTPYLENCRSEIVATSFLPTLRAYADRSFTAEGLRLELPPDAWLSQQDAHVDSRRIRPDALKSILFEISGYSPGDYEYVFRRSKSDGFFMMSLALTHSHQIGHGELNSLFKLSMLAHEIGHSTTPRESSLRERFLQLPASAPDAIVVSNEQDSYAYEKLFAEHISFIAKRLRLGFDVSWPGRLLKRKAVQNNLHLLRNHLNYLFFSGVPVDEIQMVFISKMKEIFPDFTAKSDYEWLSFSTLDQPISRIGFLRAYEEVFGS